MKKLSILFVAALAAMGAVSCDEQTKAVPASNPQLPIMGADALQIKAAAPSAIDLTSFDVMDTQIALAEITELKNLPEGYELKVVGTMGREEDYTHSADFTTTINDKNQICATADDLEGAYVAAIGKSAKPKSVYLRFQAYAVNGDATVMIGGPEVYYAEQQVTITPIDLGIVIEDAYGLVGTINGWSVGNAVMFKHSDENVYDDPIFTLTVTITPAEADGGWWWKVLPQSTIATGNWQDVVDGSFGPAENGDHSLEGNLIGRTETSDSQAGCINEPGVYVLTIDMENQTYEFVPQYDFLYTPGNSNGWNQGNSQPLIAPVGELEFQGFAKLNGEFKFTTKPNWNGDNYGAGDTAGTISTAGGNLSAAAGTYYAKVNLDDLTYSLTKITSVGLIGSFNGWGSQLNMSSTDGLVYTVQATFADGDEWKVRMNDDWGINLGGDLQMLEFGGANIKVAAGTYTVKLDLSKVPYTLTLTK